MKHLLLILCLIFPSFAWATLPCTTCTYPGTSNSCDDGNAQTFCAASLSASDVQTAVTAAISQGGDITVYLPSDGGSPPTWTAGSQYLTIDTGGTSNYLRLVGYGESETTIYNFQIRLPSDRKTNITELGHMTIDGTQSVVLLAAPSGDDSLSRPETEENELYWHNLTIKNYTSAITLVNWRGVVANVEYSCIPSGGGQNPSGILVYGDGVYSDHTNELGTRGVGLFFEGVDFYDCGHAISQFCDGTTVVRNTSFHDCNTQSIDVHGPEHNFCIVIESDEESEFDHQAGNSMEAYNTLFEDCSYGPGPRSGWGGIIWRTGCDGTPNCVHMKIENGSCGNGDQGALCGDGAGETHDRCNTDNCTSCYEAIQAYHVWDTSCFGDGCITSEFSLDLYCDDGTMTENEAYFFRAPQEGDQIESWTPYQMPHPLVQADYPTATVVDSINEFESLSYGSAGYDSLFGGGSSSTQKIHPNMGGKGIKLTGGNVITLGDTE